MIDPANGTWVDLAIASIVVGIIATFVADLWSWLLRAVARIPGGNWAFVGRWVAGFSRGVFVHHPISAATPVRGELAIGWAFHYVVGIVYAAVYLLIVTVGLNTQLGLTSALVFAWVTLIAPWFVMQPALGLGFMAARAPKPAVSRAISISVHTWFGIGLYLGALAWSTMK